MPSGLQGACQHAEGRDALVSESSRHDDCSPLRDARVLGEMPSLRAPNGQPLRADPLRRYGHEKSIWERPVQLP